MTGIIITLGPSISTVHMLQKIYDIGVRVLRLNFPHINYDLAEKYKELIASVKQDMDDPFLLLLDTQGPSIRLGNFSGVVAFKKGDILKLVVHEKLANYKKGIVFCDYKYLIEDSHVGDIIKIDSGRFDVEVVKKTNEYLLVKGLSDANLASRKHVNLPGIKLRLPAISQKDKADLEFAAQHGFAYVALSFVSSEKDIIQVREILDQAGGHDVKIISKIENVSAMEDLHDIVAYSDMLMVARGDLGVELPYEKVPVFQRQIIDACRLAQKPVIVATEMLESMIEQSIPTRAEVNDIFSSVEEGAGFLMLSGETAIGNYPIETIEVMQKVVAEAELYMSS